MSERIPSNSSWKRETLFCVLTLFVCYAVDLIPYYVRIFRGSDLRVEGGIRHLRTPCRELPARDTACAAAYVIPFESFAGAEAIGLGFFLSSTEIYCSNDPNRRLRFGGVRDASQALDVLRTYQTIDLSLLPCRTDLIVEAWGPDEYRRAGYVGGPLVAGSAAAIKQLQKAEEFFAGPFHLLLAIVLFAAWLVTRLVLRRVVEAEGKEHAGEVLSAYSGSWAAFALVKSGLPEIFLPAIGDSFFYIRFANFISGLAHLAPGLSVFAGGMRLLWLALPLLALALSPFFASWLGIMAFLCVPLYIAAFVARRQISLLFFAGAAAVETGKLFNVPFLPYGNTALTFASFVILNEFLGMIRRSARTADRLRSVEHTSKQVAHDIRSPLAALRVATGELEKVPEGQRRIVRNAISRINDIADALLQRPKKVVPREVDETLVPSALQETVDSIVAEKRLQYRARTTVKISRRSHSPGAILYAKVETVALARVLSNLVDNAVDALEGGGCVEVEVKRDAGFAVIIVKDDGKGIPSDVIPKLMYEGATFGKANGSGLGLFHAKTVLERWGGSIGLSSVEGKGTTVEIRLSSCECPESKPEFVLIDDDDLVAASWEYSAAKFGKKLLRFRSGQEFLSLAETFPRSTAIYIDLRLADGTSGVTVARNLREKGFTRLALATGEAPGSLDLPPWLPLVGKNPPWE